MSKCMPFTRYRDSVLVLKNARLGGEMVNGHGWQR